jgi:hypothetical protein
VRKLWYAGAVIASGMLLFGASPARADLLPGTGTAEQQADEQLAGLLGQSNGINVSNPLRYSTLRDTPAGSRPVMQFHSGQNSPDLNPLLPGRAPGEARPALPAADVAGGALRPGNGLPLRNLLAQLFGGLQPNGGMSSVLQRPTTRQAEAFDGGLPLLGGLGGVLPVNDRPRTPDGSGPDVAGLPAGGVAIIPAATTVTASVPPTFGQPAAQPAAAQPAAPVQPAGEPAAPAPEQPKPDVTPDDPRLHEEPIDNETAPRPFSADGRPVAGVDQEYK